jgi:hypothetical protein
MGRKERQTSKDSFSAKAFSRWSAHMTGRGKFVRASQRTKMDLVRPLCPGSWTLEPVLG